MKITLLRQATLPLLILPTLFPLSLLAEENDNTLVVSATPSESGLNVLDTPAAVSVVSGDEMRQAAPRVNLSENLSSVTFPAATASVRIGNDSSNHLRQ